MNSSATPTFVSNVPECSKSDMAKYASGECAISLVMNSILGFAMIYYTDALGLKASLAGVAMSVATFWEAISDPIMGHITDNTRSRFGRRHPHLLIGTIVTVVSFFFLWHVPGVFRQSSIALFWYLLGINLIQRTGITIFLIPYTALGFEMCADYRGRARLQGIRFGCGMLANLCGPALAWAVFFSNNNGIRATKVEANYVDMGLVFSLAALAFMLVVLFSSSKYIEDTRQAKLNENSVRSFLLDMKGIVLDRYPRAVFGYVFVVILGVALVSGLQMYLFEHFFELSGIKKTIAHGGTMVGAGIGALLAANLVARFDKRGAVILAGVWSISCALGLALLFATSILPPQQSLIALGFNLPIAFMVFVILHGAYWLGNGIMIPIATSMMADVSEIHQIETGVAKEGAYAAVFSFVFKCAMSVAMFITGIALAIAGFQSGVAHAQAPAVVERLPALTFVLGPVISLLGLWILKRYPVNREFLEAARKSGTDRAST